MPEPGRVTLGWRARTVSHGWIGGLVPVLVALGACTSSGGSTGRYCDVVKQAEAASDPLADQQIYNDPARLKAALLVRVHTYTDLAGRAPSGIRADANAVRDGVIKVNNALSKHDYQSATANTDPVVQAVLADKSFADATARLKTFNATACVG